MSSKYVVRRPRHKKAYRKKMYKPRPSVGIHPELKGIDFSTAAPFNLLSAAGLLTYLFPIGQGVGSDQRIGRRIIPKTIEFRAQGSVLSTPQSSPLRMALIYDRAINGTLPAVTDIFAQDSLVGALALGNSKRFHVFMDEIIEGVGYSAGPSSFYVKRFIKVVGDYPMEWVGTGSTPANQTVGAFYMVTWNNSSIANFSGAYYVRLRYTDV